MKLYLVGVKIGVAGRLDIEFPSQRVGVNILAHSEEEARWRGEAHVRASIRKYSAQPEISSYVAFHVSEILDKDAGPHILWKDDDAKTC